MWGSLQYRLYTEAKESTGFTSDMQNMVLGEPERVQNGIISVCLYSTEFHA